MKKELKKAILDDKLYDFISNEGHKFSKDELIQLIKNLDYTAWQKLKFDKKDFNKQLITNLNDYDFFEEED